MLRKKLLKSVVSSLLVIALVAAMLSLSACGNSFSKVGDTGTFGTYQGEAISWTVLAVEDGKALLLADSILDCQPYNDSLVDDLTWSDCSLRTWLNDSFLNDAFTAEEQAKILDSSLEDAGTTDKVFVLSQDELKEYLQATESRFKGATSYALEQGVALTGDYGYWWLRTTDDANTKRVWAVNYQGTLGTISTYDYGTKNDSFVPTRSDVGVLPAVWISL